MSMVLSLTLIGQDLIILILFMLEREKGWFKWYENTRQNTQFFAGRDDVAG